MATCDFYYDFSSPFAYLGATQIQRVCEGHTLVWKPFLLGGLFKEIGTPVVPLSTFAPAKIAHAMKDMHRWADHLGVRFRFPSQFPQRTITPLRVVLQVPPELMGPLSVSLFEIMWVDDGDMNDPTALTQAIDKHGLDAPALLAGTQDPRIKAKLKANTDEAVAAGVCGAPCSVVDGMVFWGQDRLQFVRKALEGWVPEHERLEIDPMAGSTAR